MDPNLQKRIDAALQSLRERLGDNLYSCCLYGSSVRGNLIPGISDINLLIVLNSSTAQAHEQIANSIGSISEIDPFILARRGFERSVRAFATKFSSIRRNYRVLAGQDPFSGVQIDPELEKFLCEQAIRNLRLRLVYAFVTRARNKTYDRFVVRNVTPIFIQLSEALRLQGISIPTAFEERVPLLAREFAISPEVLSDLLQLKRRTTRWSEAEAEQWHQRLFPLLDAVIVWIEAHWKG